MNNYLAKPVKPNTLKALLESYLSKETPEDTNLQRRTNEIVEAEVSKATSAGQIGEAARSEEQQNGQEQEDGVSMPERPKHDYEVKTAEEQAVRSGGAAEQNGVDGQEKSSEAD